MPGSASAPSFLISRYVPNFANKAKTHVRQALDAELDHDLFQKMHLIGHCLQAHHVAQPAAARCRRATSVATGERAHHRRTAALFPPTPELLGRRLPRYAKPIRDHLQNPYHGIPCPKRRVPVLCRLGLVGRHCQTTNCPVRSSRAKYPRHQESMPISRTNLVPTSRLGYLLINETHPSKPPPRVRVHNIAPALAFMCVCWNCFNSFTIPGPSSPSVAAELFARLRPRRGESSHVDSPRRATLSSTSSSR